MGITKLTETIKKTKGVPANGPKQKRAHVDLLSLYYGPIKSKAHSIVEAEVRSTKLSEPTVEVEGSAVSAGKRRAFELAFRRPASPIVTATTDKQASAPETSSRSQAALKQTLISKPASLKGVVSSTPKAVPVSGKMDAMPDWMSEPLSQKPPPKRIKVNNTITVEQFVNTVSPPKRLKIFQPYAHIASDLDSKLYAHLDKQKATIHVDGSPSIEKSNERKRRQETIDKSLRYRPASPRFGVEYL
ncbi:MAG: hypothetical protein J3Q66DRAFT_428727 [Benniella sp.]|nr:MAG: hypothetical protein J3Q66DRAFT_428727 [Benniella sp.]